MPEQVELKLKINGMHCDACVRRVSGALGALPGVRVDRVEVGEADFAYDPLKTDTETIAAAIQDIGFEASL
jgi:copper chaperone CopZ